MAKQTALAKYRARARAMAIELRTANATIDQLRAEVHSLLQPSTPLARYEVEVVVGDGSKRKMLSEPCSRDVAQREVRELSATGYKARVVPA